MSYLAQGSIFSLFSFSDSFFSNLNSVSLALPTVYKALTRALQGPPIGYE